MDINEHDKLFIIILRNSDCIAIQHYNSPSRVFNNKENLYQNP
jgi:hypothetical protein